jgi:hypothetical protein
MYRRGIPLGLKSLSVRKKSPTSAWGRSTSSTRKTSERPGSAKGLLEAADVAEAADAAEAVQSADAPEAVQSAVAPEADAPAEAAAADKPAAEAAEAPAAEAGAAEAVAVEAVAVEAVAPAVVRRGEFAASARLSTFRLVDRRSSLWPGSTRPTMRYFQRCQRTRGQALSG